MRNKEHEKQRLLDAVRKAIEAARLIAESAQPTSPSLPTADVSQPSIPTDLQAKAPLEPSDTSNPVSPPPPSVTPRQLGMPYQAATLAPVTDDFSAFYKDPAPALIRERLLALLAVEAPITVADATRRVAACWGGQNLTKRAQGHLLECIKPLLQAQQLLLDPGDILWLNQQQRDQWQGFRRPPQAGRSLDSVPPVEMRTALLTITHAALSIDADSLLRETCKSLTGAPNFTEQRRQILQQQLDQLLASKQLKVRDGRIFAAEAD